MSRTNRAVASAAIAICILASVLLPALPASADEPEAPASDTARSEPKASAEQIGRWVKDMDADKAAVRNEAVTRLTAAGRAAIPAVTKAARGDGLEVTVRSVTVLKNLASSSDAATKAAAKAALEDLAKDEKHESGAQAREALKALQPAPAAPVFAPGRIVIGGNAIAGGVVQINAGAGRFTVSTTQAGGIKTTDVDDNGRKIKIVEDAKSIAVTVTEPAGGDKQPKTKTYEAADAKELKTKHPEAHKLYEKYGKQAAGVANIQIMGGAVPIRVGPANVAAARRPRMMRRGDAVQLLKEAEKELADAIKALQAARDAETKRVVKPEDKLDPTALLKRLRQAMEKLTKARKGLDPAELIKRLRPQADPPAKGDKE